MTGTAGRVLSSKSSKTLNITVTDEEEMLQRLRKHNQRFSAQPIYVPCVHAVRDVRQWEMETGKQWSSLRPDQKAQANADIETLKKKKCKSLL